MSVDQRIRTELLKMATPELFQLIDSDLDALSKLRDAGLKPTCGHWKQRLAEIEAARSVIVERF